MNQEDFKNRYKYDPTTDRLGEGGFGEVFKAYDTFLDKWVAMKISKVKADFQELRLKNEVDLVNQLPVHPNVARYEECYTYKTISGEHDFAILQYYETGNLLQVLSKQELSLSQKHYLLTSLLEGIHFIHTQGIIHRDLKPQNVLIVYRNNNYIPKITDFGISKKLSATKTTQFINSLIGAGTITYSSPEQLADSAIRKNADLWSFGIIAYQVLTGETPFNAGSHSTSSELGRQEMMKQINSGKLPDLINQVPIPWKNIIENCLIIDPNKRMKDAETCIDMLKGINPTESKMQTKRRKVLNDDETQIVPTGNAKRKKTFNYKALKKTLIACAVVIFAVVIIMVVVNTQQNAPINKILDIPNDSLAQINIPIVETEEKPDSLISAVEIEIKELPDQKPEMPEVKTPVEDQIVFPNGNIYTGQLVNGKMHGKGKYIYKTGGLISEYDRLERKAEAGDYVDGDWDNGGLYKGHWYDKNGVLKSMIIIGRN